MTTSTGNFGNTVWNKLGVGIGEGFPVERMTTSGMEYTVDFIVPAANRFKFLDYMFGRWKGTGDPLNDPYGQPGATLISGNGCTPGSNSVLPCHYPITDYLYPTMPNPNQIVYADTYTISPIDPRSVGVGVTYNGVAIGDDEFRCPAINPSCAVKVSINFRSKNEYLPPALAACNKCLGSNLAAAVEATHGFKPADVFPNPHKGTFLETSVETELTVQTSPSDAWHYECIEEGGVKKKLDPDQTVGIQVTTTTYNFTWSNVPNPPFSHINRIAGTVNKYPWLHYPPEAVLFYSPRWTDRRTWSGNTVYDIEYVFVAKTVKAIWAGYGVKAPPGGWKHCKAISVCEDVGIWNRSISCTPAVLCYNTTNDGDGSTCTSCDDPISATSVYFTPFQRVGIASPVCLDKTAEDGDSDAPFSTTGDWGYLWSIVENQQITWPSS